MTPAIALGLLTCNREQYTQRTLETLALHNDLSRFILVHADDASETPDNMDIASDHGFRESFRAHRREGQFSMLKCLLAMAQRKRAEWFLYLENDWEWVAPFPWEVMDSAGVEEFPGGHLHPRNFQCLRLYGAYKGRVGPRQETGKHFMGTRLPIDWKPAVTTALPGYEAACAHWAGPPSVTYMSVLAPHVAECKTFKEVSTGLWPATVRPVDNVVWHIGQQQTQDFRA